MYEIRFSTRLNSITSTESIGADKGKSKEFGSNATIPSFEKASANPFGRLFITSPVKSKLGKPSNKPDIRARRFFVSYCTRPRTVFNQTLPDSETRTLLVSTVGNPSLKSTISSNFIFLPVKLYRSRLPRRATQISPVESKLSAYTYSPRFNVTGENFCPSHRLRSFPSLYHGIWSGENCKSINASKFPPIVSFDEN